MINPWAIADNSEWRGQRFSGGGGRHPPRIRLIGRIRLASGFVLSRAEQSDRYLWSDGSESRSRRGRIRRVGCCVPCENRPVDVAGVLERLRGETQPLGRYDEG